MQLKLSFNYGWLYKEAFSQDDINCSLEVEGYEEVDLPHTNKVLPFNYFDEQSYQFISCYKKIFTIQEDICGKQVFLDFEGVMAACELWCNGIHVGSHIGGYTPFTVDMTVAIKVGEENVLVIKVDSTERSDIPPFGGVVDFLTYGGIYREASLRISDSIHINRLWLSCQDPLAEIKKLSCSCEITSLEVGTAGVSVTIFDPDGNEVGGSEIDITLAVGRKRYEVALENLCNIALWDLENPALYTVTVVLDGLGVNETFKERFGFRKAEFTQKGFFLNGELIKLVGLNRHQSWPYVGYAMPKRIQRKDAEILKLDAGCNIVRTSHYPQSRHFLDACDELGLLVMEELPGWQHVGDQVWQNQAVKDVEDMIVRDFNRPSIILWGVRINESQDYHDFYSRTNEVARSIDNGRQTGGTRFIQRSEFLEDVYTYNDFSFSGGDEVFRPQRESTGLDRDVPTLVTESIGHMYPTKRFDQEERVVEHALRHLRIIDESIGRADLCGGISWCAFDYNTHGCFGSGDKVCYHGVYDMFRNQKYAAYAYESQKSPRKAVVLEPITVASRGERDGGGSVPFYVLTNCDQVRVYKNGKLVDDFYPEREEYPNLEHPPVLITHLMEKEMDFGFSPEDLVKFHSFLDQKLRSGTITNMGKEDFMYLGGLAKQYGLEIKEFITVVIRSAGGWGEKENIFVIEGILDGKTVCRREIGERKYSAGLVVEADDRILICGGSTYDATRITIRVVDNMGNLMPFTQECVDISVTGPGSILGPVKFALVGGIASCWVRTLGSTGEINLLISGMNESVECKIEVQEVSSNG